MKKRKLYIGNRRKTYTRAEVGFVMNLLCDDPYSGMVTLGNDPRFPPGHHFYPAMDKCDGLIALTTKERAGYLRTLGVYAIDLLDWNNPMDVSDIECLLDNELIPTHRDADVPLYEPSPLLIKNSLPLPPGGYYGIRDSIGEQYAQPWKTQLTDRSIRVTLDLDLTPKEIEAFKHIAKCLAEAPIKITPTSEKKETE